MDDVMDRVDPLVQVALMDAYYEMTDDRYHEADLERILTHAARQKDEGEELYMAARLALGRLNGKLQDTLSDLVSGLKVTAIRTTRGLAPPRGARAERPTARSTITIMIHGTWASDGTWWRPGGDFFEYVKTDLARPDLYGKRDQFKWSGKNRDSSRRMAAVSLDAWLRKHPADEVNVFAHSHGANVAMLATHRSIRINRLVMLSPPVRDDYFAKWSNVGAAYNIQASFDPVVAIARGGQWFPRGIKVKQKKLRASGHSSSHYPQVWREENLAAFVGIPWA
jgi:pimeloyl-ACP methyl ester carboxylesterase